MTKSGNLYTMQLDPILDSSKILYYISATDEFNQTAFKGDDSSPFIYGGKAENTNIIDQAKKYYNDYEFYVGMGSVVILWITAKLIYKLIKRKVKKNKL